MNKAISNLIFSATGEIKKFTTGMIDMTCISLRLDLENADDHSPCRVSLWQVNSNNETPISNML